MRIPRWLAVPFILVMILYWVQDMWKSNSEPSVFDLPKTLDEEVLTIDVFPVSNVQSVPVFTTSEGSSKDDYLYLTPASDTAIFPDNFHALRDSGYDIRATGQFYKGRAIPAEYLQVVPKPDRLRVFQFKKIEMVKNLKGVSM